jgi:putative ATPase, AAA-superfamily
MSTSSADEIRINEQDLVKVMQLAAAGNASGSGTLLRRLARKYRETAPTFAAAIVKTLRESPLRSAETGLAIDRPIDTDSKLALLREEDPVVLITEPILDASTTASLRQITDEHRNSERLFELGLAPTRTALFVGAPGVGKTLAARWIARELGLPLLVLDLSSVMSSFLGRTGANVRRVLDYARSTPAVLLLDELDAVAKRRDDATEIGELKRLVTVLLQEIDSWPEGSLLLAATNHADLLDPAVWRRFEVVVNFELPNKEALKHGVQEFLDDPHADPAVTELIAQLYTGETLNHLERDIIRARRIAALSEKTATDALFSLVGERFQSMPAKQRGPAAARLLDSSDLTQREVHEITGVSRDTLRKYVRQLEGGESDA